MKCPKCQSDNAEGKKFCGKCGASLSLVCPHCGAPVPSDDDFCGECGRRVREAPSGEKQIPGPEGERKHVTVLFSDLSGYTAMSEKLDPEEVKEITTRLFGEVAQVVSRYDGLVEKYIGDAVVALFGVPKTHEDDHLRAIRAAREIHNIVNAVGNKYEDKIGTPLAFHTGISKGLVVTGEVNLEKGTHGVAGDTINVASRLSGLAKPGEILVGESIYLDSKGAFSFERLQPASVKGKAEPVTPYRLVEEKEKPSRGLASQGLTSPLVGRNAEVAAIKGCLNRLLDGQGGILSLIGEAGLGKSRLMAEIRQAFAHENLFWLEGKTLSYGQKMSYWPFREILWQFTGITDDDSNAEAWEKFERKIVDLFPTETGEILPYLAGLIGLEVKGDLAKSLAHMDGESMGKQVYLSSRRFFERLAGSSPLVLVFEDLHWADESTVALIAHLFPLINRVPLLVCGVIRPETGAPAVRLRETALKDHERRYTEIRLSPLSSTESTDLMNNLLTVENLPSRTRQLILQKAEGNPFFLEEIMRTLVDRGAVRSENGRWRATSSIETITIPDTIHGVIMARIDRLDDELKDVLKAASVIGRAFLYRLLKEVTDAIKQLDHHLDTLAATELIREKQKVPELEYIFKHALVQESTYESILLKKRMELHGKVASAIEKLLSDRLDELASILAYHYAKAESWEKAQEYLFKAGDQAGRIAADAEALTHYQQALETYARVFGDKWDPVKRGVLERKMGEAFYRRGEWEKAMEYLQRALVFFGQPKLATAPSKVKLATTKELCVQLFRRLFSRALTKRTYGPVDEAVEQVARIYDILATYYIVASPDHFLLTMLTYLNFSERKGYLPGIISPSASLAFVVSNFSLFRLSRSLLRRGEILTRQTEDLHAIGWLQFMSACITYNAGQLDKAIEHCLKTIEVSRMRGYWSLTHWGYLNHVLVYAYYLQGDMKNSPAIAREAIRIGEDANEPIIVAIGLDILGHVQEREGNFQECAVTLTRSMELFKAISDHGHVLWAGGSLGRCYCRMGDVERGLAVLRETDAYGTTHKIIQFRHFIALPLYMAYLAAADQDGQAKKDRLKKARQVGKRVFKLAKIYQVCLPRAERLEGIYDWLAEKQASAQKHWNRSLTLAEEMGMHYELGMTHLEMGRRLNDHEHLQKAGAIFAEIGAEGDLAETRRLLEGFQG